MAPSARTRRTASSANTAPSTDPTPPAAEASGARKSKRKSPSGIGANNPTGDVDQTPPAPPRKVQKAKSTRPTGAKATFPEPPLPPPVDVSATINPQQLLPSLSANSNTTATDLDDQPSESVQEHPEETDVAVAASMPSGTGVGDEPVDDLAALNVALQKEVRTLKKYKVMWAKQQMEKSSLTQDEVSDGSITRPPGERGKNGWNMQTALQLEADGDAYNAILATTRDAVRQAGLDWHFKFDEQEPARLGAAYSQIKRLHPYLKRFKNDWACRELVLAALQNRRKTEAARNKSLTAKSPVENSKPANKSKSKRTGFKPRSKSTAPSTSTAGPSNGDVNSSGEESAED